MANSDGKSQSGDKRSEAAQQAAREKRLAQALRDNLRRRKAPPTPGAALPDDA